MKTRIFFATIILLSFGGAGGGLFAQITYIPDLNFEEALIDLGIDSDGIPNGQVLTADIEGVVALDVSNKGIENLTGIEDFAALEDLNVSFNYHGFQSLDLSGNSQLVKLDFRASYNLMNINLSNNLLLEYIISDISLLTELDVSNNVLLKVLQIGTPDVGGISEANIIQTLDLSNNPLLERLWLVDMTILDYINLKSGGNEILTDVYILCNIEGYPCGLNLCIEVDNLAAAQSNQPPYNSWSIHSVIYSEDCSLSVPSLEKEFVSIYPIPVKETIFIENLGIDKNMIATIFSIDGKFLFSKNVNTLQNAIQVENLKSGLYFIVLEDKDKEGAKTTIKFVKN